MKQSKMMPANPKTSLASDKYSPKGSGASKSEGPIAKDDKKLCGK